MEELTKLKNPPIVEAIVEMDCDLPPSHDLLALETSAQQAFTAEYPVFRKTYLQEHRIDANPEGPAITRGSNVLIAFQFFKQDEKQLVQLRPLGFTFNRLAPYSSLDDYLPEIEQAWRLYVQLASPSRVQRVRLRYINRILLPMLEGKVELDHYLKIGPKLPGPPDLLQFGSFFNQHSAIEAATQNRVNIILANQPSEGDKLPILFDISAERSVSIDEPADWEAIADAVAALRRLKNTIFRDTLKQECISLFQY